MNHIHTRRIATLLFAALYTTTFTPLLAKSDQKEDTPLTSYARLAEYHLPSLAQKAMIEERANEARKKQNFENAQNKKLNDIEIPTLGEVEKLKLSYHLLGLLETPSKDRSGFISHEAINDLELLCGPKDITEHHLFDAIDNTVTSFGKIELQKMLLTPLTDVKKLTDRQTFVKKLVEDEQFFNHTQKLLEQMKASENDVIWFWKTIEEEVEQFFEQIYYGTLLSGMNKSSTGLQVLHSWQTVGIPGLALTWPLLIVMAGTGMLKKFADSTMNLARNCVLLNREVPAINDNLNRELYDRNHPEYGYRWRPLTQEQLNQEIQRVTNEANQINEEGSAAFARLDPAQQDAINAQIRDGFLQEIVDPAVRGLGMHEHTSEEQRNGMVNPNASLAFFNTTAFGAQTLGHGLKWMMWNGAILNEKDARIPCVIGTALIGLIYVWPLVASLRSSANINKISNVIHEKMINVATFTNTLQTMGHSIAKHPALTPLFPENQALLNMNAQGSAEAKELVTMLQTDSFKGHATPLALKGKVLASYKIMQSAKDNLINAFQAAGKLDAYMSIAKLYKQNATNGNAQFCFVEYKTGVLHPYLNIENYWHPILDPNKVVTNSIHAGLEEGAGNIIITGPNAGGKSTSLKAISLSILLAQTLGVAPAQQMKLTPFALFKTHLNIVDSEGKESLFQAEMHRAEDLINDIKKLKSNEFSFTILDEIFTGTNPEEGQAGAYGVAKYLSQLGNSMCFVATHYKKLTELDTATNGRYKNYKVSVIFGNNGSITPTYKLTEGISDQKIGLQLMQNAGFGSDIMDAAHEVMNSIKANGR